MTEKSKENSIGRTLEYLANQLFGKPAEHDTLPGAVMQVFDVIAEYVEELNTVWGSRFPMYKLAIEEMSDKKGLYRTMPVNRCKEITEEYVSLIHKELTDLIEMEREIEAKIQRDSKGFAKDFKFIRQIGLKIEPGYDAEKIRKENQQQQK